MPAPNATQRRMFYRGLMADTAEPADGGLEDEALVGMVSNRRAGAWGFEFLRGSDFTGNERPVRFRTLRLAWRKYHLEQEGEVPVGFKAVCQKLRDLNVARTIRRLSWRFVSVAHSGSVDDWIATVERSVGKLREKLGK